MSYQVLARKWRPNRFAELVGQEHVVSAISNALTNNRLHHAYLFTGTRGVGKTTIARIFSKSLNCEKGMSADPCGECPTCIEIEQGNYVDLLEIDAASRTKVEDTRELLDNVQYKPTRGQYKVYLIDEVHMLSKHSFNALLKTLEEPPPHVKFLLATTDPQKLPITILSRCLQFNLKALSREQIVQQLQHILTAEQIVFDDKALAQLARAAQGSMRDALSLTDQAIAQGNGQVAEQTVTDMLGLMDKGKVLKLVHALFSNDKARVFTLVEDFAAQAIDFQNVLNELMSVLHQIALTQFVPDACKLETVSARAIYQLAKQTPAEQVQLFYQIALQGKQDLHAAPDGRTGLEMTLIRMMAFNPQPLEIDSDSFRELPPSAPPQQAPQASPSPSDDNQSAEREAAAAPHADAVQPAMSEAEEPQPQPQVSAQPHTGASHSAEPEMPEPPQDDDALAEQRAMDAFNAEQDNLLAQAESLHPDMYSDNLDHSAHEVPPGEPDGLTYETGESHPSENAAGANDEAPQSGHTLSHTESLLALKQKLNATAQTPQEGDADVKKPVTEDSVFPPIRTTADATASSEQDESLGTQNQDAPSTEHNNKAPVSDDSLADENPVIAAPKRQQPAAQPIAAAPVVEPEAAERADVVAQPEAVKHADTNAHSEEASPALPADEPPPWVSEPLQSSADGQGVSPNLEPAPAFNPLEHLDDDLVGEVDFDVPAFLSDGTKVLHAHQLDTWSQLIEHMQVAALTKQLALHSSYQQQNNKVILTLMDGKQHLDTPSARQQLQSALSEALQQAVELDIHMGEPVNTPYAVQQAVNSTRLQHARQVVEKDESIAILRDMFSAKVVEDSIKPR